MSSENPIEILVYSKPDCQQCLMTMRHLDKLGLPYRYFDVTKDERAYDAVTLLGYRQLPVVAVGDLHWSGYRDAKLDRLAEIYSTAANITNLEATAVQYLTDEDAALESET
ncbi:glutaredoxin family protein [Nocardia sp. NPDC057440]|uniref:glutaredoxin family protein n=1 Tax=Nocardia sp. NPDC057440 TaxID=3346134 RepID=UPI00366E7947